MRTHPKSKHHLFIMVCIFSTLLTGCATRAYDVIIYNKTQTTINGASLNYEGFKSDFGTVVANGKAQYSMVKAPVPEKAKVAWEATSGKRHQQEVEVKRLVPKNFVGKIFFKIKEDGSVEVAPITADDYYKNNKRP